MAQRRHIHNIDTLEREIYRLQLHSKNMEQRIDENFSYLQKNFSSMAMGSIFSKKSGKSEIKDQILGSIFSNEKLQGALGRVIDHLIDKIVEGAENLAGHFKEEKSKSRDQG